MHDATKSCMGKDLFKVQNGSMNFKVAAYEKFIDKISDSTLQLIFKKLSCVEFSNIKECQQLSEKAIKVFLLYQMYP